MNIQLISDIHTEFFKDRGQDFITHFLDPKGVDVLIVAGDASNSQSIVQTLTYICKRYEKAVVLYTYGNHEGYGSSFDEVKARVVGLARRMKNLKVLDNKEVKIGSLRFAGTPLWFRDDPLNVLYEKRMNDFVYIRNFNPWVYGENRKSEAFLRSVLESDPPDVVITHYLPTVRAITPQYKGDPLNRFFVAPIADEVPVLPRVWCFGHSHTSMNFEHRGCLFLSNPFGYYPREVNPVFNNKLIIKLD